LIHALNIAKKRILDKISAVRYIDSIMASFTHLKIIFWGMLLVHGGSAIAEERTDLPDFSQVTPNLYRGGRPTDAGLTQLKKMGVRTIINLQGGDLESIPASLLKNREPGEFPEAIVAEGNAADELQLNFRHYPLDSMGFVDASEQNSILQILADLTDPNLQPIYVHCEHGEDRTGLIVAMERVQLEGWTKTQARAEWTAFGHDGMKKILMGGLDLYFYNWTPTP
jgi:tyrosine-protein phosphatase SIW14